MSYAYALLMLAALLLPPPPGEGRGEGASANPTAALASEAARFTTVALYLDPGDQPLAAYQLEFRVIASGDDSSGGGGASGGIVGIEGGDHPAFRDPPYYDPKAIKNDRAILAAFSTRSAADLPRGRTRIATVHLQVTGEARYSVELVAAGGAEDQSISATIDAKEGT